MSTVGPAASLPAHVLAGQLDLKAAWDRVRRNHGMSGADGTSIGAFSRAAAARLRGIETELATGGYRPWPLRLASVRRTSGSVRTLLVPSVRDRVGQTAVAAWLSSRIDHRFDPASFAYRPNRGVRDALRALAAYRDEGFRYVLDADIRGCFDAVQHDVLLGALARWLGGDSPLLSWVGGWIAAPVWDGQSLRTRTKGLPQGSPISPLLANVMLHPLDRRLHASHAGLVRYADDFVVVARNPVDLADATRLVVAALADLGFTLNPDKTTRTSFDEGFRFLGADVRAGRIWLPIDAKVSSRSTVDAAAPMPPALRRAYRAGQLTASGPFTHGAVRQAPEAPPHDRPSGDRSHALDRLRGTA